MEGEAICDGKPKVASSWGKIGGALAQTLRGEHGNGTPDGLVASLALTRERTRIS